MLPSRGSPHDSGSPWFATPSVCGSLIHSFPAGLSRRTDVPAPQLVRLRREQLGAWVVRAPSSSSPTTARSSNPGESTYHVTGSTQPIELGGDGVVAVGRNRLLVTARTYPNIALQQNGVVTTVKGLTGRPFAFRSRPSGSMWMATSAAGVRGELLEIATDVMTQTLGAFDFGPAPYGRHGLRAGAAGHPRVHQPARGVGDFPP